MYIKATEMFSRKSHSTRFENPDPDFNLLETISDKLK